TKELLKKLHASKKFSIRCILLKKSVGSAKARNMGIEKAKYENIALTDSDCIVSKNWLKDLVPYLEKYDLIGGKVKYMDQAEDKMNPFQKINKIISIKQNSLINFLNTNNLIFKRKICLEIGGFLDYRLEDVDFSWRLLKRGYKLLYVPKGLVIHYGTRNPLQNIKKYLIYGRSYSKLVTIHNLKISVHKTKTIDTESFKDYIKFASPSIPFIIFLLIFSPLINNIFFLTNSNIVLTVLLAYFYAKIFRRADIIFRLFISSMKFSIMTFLFIYYIKK
ncbi:MAG: glycosyltransferase, partial [Candidatus Helarchaeota archaeon]|nr:glycosyltransferase [Candidatus Helarchaeota archaeon]